MDTQTEKRFVEALEKIEEKRLIYPITNEEEFYVKVDINCI